jgi:glycosyltransferase involved in cell wall biosynthesis
VDQIDEGQLLAYYQTTHLYWSASEHEGFGAPLIEAMWFDIPVLALNESAVGETLGEAGVLYEKWQPLNDVALRAYELIHNEQRRREVIGKQRLQRLKFCPEAVASKVIELCEALESDATEPCAQPSVKEMQR